MRNWIIDDLYRMILFSALSGTAAYLVWRLLAFGMTEKKKLKYVYPMLAAVMAFFFVPVLELWFEHLYVTENHTAWIGNFFQWTPFIYKLRHVLMAVWLTGTAVNIGFWVYRLLAMRRLVAKHMFPAEKELVERKDKLAAALRLRQRVNICRCYAVSSPIVTGLWRKTVVLPVEEYEEEQLEVILCHELVHIRQHIVDFKHIGGIIQTFQWFNPCVYALMQSLDEWGETACDLEVRFDTVCRLPFCDYFGMVLDGIEKDQVILPGSVTEFQKLKGVKERMRKVKNYKREKDLKLAGGILAMSMFIGLSTATVLAAGTGYDQVHSMLYEATAVSEKVSMDPLPAYTEVEGVLTAEQEQNAVVMPIIERRDGSFSVDWDVPAGQTYMTTGFNVSSGTIRVVLSIEPDYETIEVGIVKPNGTTTSIDAEDMVLHSFTASEEGKYKFYVKNTGSEEVSVTGTVKY